MKLFHPFLNHNSPELPMHVQFAWLSSVNFQYGGRPRQVLLSPEQSGVMFNSIQLLRDSVLHGEESPDLDPLSSTIKLVSRLVIGYVNAVYTNSR